jgi:hypothetical protein
VEGNTLGTSIAVLPFKVLNTATGNLQDNEFLGTRSGRALVTRLSGVKRLSCADELGDRYGSMPTDPFAAASEIDVEYVVDGSVKRAADRIRVSVQCSTWPEKRLSGRRASTKFIPTCWRSKTRSPEQVAGALVSTADRRRARAHRKRATENPKAYEVTSAAVSLAYSTRSRVWPRR